MNPNCNHYEQINDDTVTIVIRLLRTLPTYYQHWINVYDADFKTAGDKTELQLSTGVFQKILAGVKKLQSHSEKLVTTMRIINYNL